MASSTSVIVLGSSASPFTGGTLAYTGSSTTFSKGFTVDTSSEIDVATSGQTLTLNTSGGAIALTMSGSAGALTFGGAGNTTVATNITDGGGNFQGGVTMAGTGTLTFSNTNAYAGPTTVNGGTLVEDFTQFGSSQTSTPSNYIGPTAGLFGGSTTSTLVLGGGTLQHAGSCQWGDLFQSRNDIRRQRYHDYGSRLRLAWWSASPSAAVSVDPSCR